MRARTFLLTCLSGLAVYVAVAACTSSVAEPVEVAEAAVDGTRLKSQNIVGEDGSQTFVSFYDTKLRTTCAFARAEDGELRCLPTNARAEIASQLYADPRCNVAIAVTTCPASTAGGRQYVMAKVSAGRCGESAKYDVFELGAATTEVFESTPDGCRPAKNIGTGYHRLGARISAGEFVRGELKTP